MSLSKRINWGVLLIRIALAILFLGYSIPRIFGGQKVWANVGGMLSQVNFFDFSYDILGLIILIILIICGISMASGYFFNIFAIVSSVLLALFAIKYFTLGMKVLALYALTVAIIDFALIYIGTGAYVISISLRRNSSAL